MKKHIIFIHGRHFKPNKKFLKNKWFKALQHSLKRDHAEQATLFEDVKKTFVYYGEHSNNFLAKKTFLGMPYYDKYEEDEDIIDRDKTFEILKTYKPYEFNNDKYQTLPKKNSLKEFFADISSGILSFMTIADKVITSFAPDMKEYWNRDTQFGSDVRWGLTKHLKDAMKNNEKILLISHSLGAVIAYDVLWKLSYYGEHREIRKNKLDTWITLGSPLGDETVKKNLKGAKSKTPRKYPTNIKKWINVSAEDDYICHDKTIINDYKRMMDVDISEFKIYNLAVRYNKSNPHHAIGYLIDPTVSEIVANWLDDK